MRESARDEVGYRADLASKNNVGKEGKRLLEETFRITTKKLAAEERVGDKDIIYIASPPLLCGREEIGREGRVAG